MNFLLQPRYFPKYLILIFYWFMRNILSASSTPLLLLLLSVLVSLSSSLLSAFALLLVVSLCLSYTLFSHSVILCLLQLLLYFGGLIVLFAYMLMFCSFSARVNFWAYYSFVPLLYPSISSLCPNSSLLRLTLPSGLLVFLASFLFWAMIVVVSLLDLSLGRFTG